MIVLSSGGAGVAERANGWREAASPEERAIDPRLTAELAFSMRWERVAWIDAHGWEYQEMAQRPRRAFARTPREALAAALVALAVRLAPPVAAARQT